MNEPCRTRSPRGSLRSGRRWWEAPGCCRQWGIWITGVDMTFNNKSHEQRMFVLQYGGPEPQVPAGQDFRSIHWNPCRVLMSVAHCVLSLPHAEVGPGHVPPFTCRVMPRCKRDSGMYRRSEPKSVGQNQVYSKLICSAKKPLPIQHQYCRM